LQWIGIFQQAANGGSSTNVEKSCRWISILRAASNSEGRMISSKRDYALGGFPAVVFMAA
jgi:hypothetical protein